MRKENTMKKITIAVAAVILVCCFLTACQPTPQEEFIQTKNDKEPLAEKIEEVEVSQDEYAELEDYDYVYEKEYKCGNKLTVNADIDAGNSEKISVLTVTEKEFEGGDSLKEILERLYPDYEFYEYKGTSEQYFEQLMLYQKILMCEKKGEPWIVDGEQIDGVPLADKYIKEAAADENFEVSNLENLEALVEQYKENYQRAVNEKNVLTDFKLKDVDGMSKQVNIQAISENDVPGLWISFVNWDDIPGTSFSVDRLNFNSPIAFRETFIYPEQFPDDADFIKAKEAAEKYIADLGLDYMSLEKVASGTHNNHRFYFTRDINGFHENYVREYFIAPQKDGEDRDVMNLWRQEYAYVEVWDGVIQSTYWANASDASVDAENVEVLPWNEIQEIFEKQMDYLLTPGPIYTSFTKLDIDRIELGYTKVLMQNSNGQYKLIPTWNFYGTENSVAKEYCFMSINAIDGTVIDRRLMY